MKRTVTALLLGVCALAGCSKKAEIAEDAAAPAASEASAPDVAERVALVKPPAPGAPARPQDIQPAGATAALLAYAYDYAIETPADRLPGLLKRHEQACASAGPLVCQVVGASTRRLGNDEASGRLELRATPAWTERFRGGLDGEAKAVGGKVTSATVETEDLSRAIVDTEATLRAKRTLRDRLENLLATRPGKLDDLMELERQFAQVQGEIDAAESELAVMRTRVQMQKVTLDYRSAGVLAPDNAFRPLAEASHGFLRNVVSGFSVLLTVVSFVLPFAVVIGPLVWLLLRRNRRRAKPQPA
jgi:hypothetical protein